VFTVRKMRWWLILNKALFPWNVSAISTQWLYKQPAFYGIKYINMFTIYKYGKSGYTVIYCHCANLHETWACDNFLHVIRILNFTKIGGSLGADTR
jgi:hypothetical protein